MIRLLSVLNPLPLWQRLIFLSVLGAAAALALPPYDAWASWFVVVPILLLLLRTVAPDASGQAFFLGWAFGFGYFLLALYWIGNAFLVEAEAYLWMMPFAVGGLAMALAIYWGMAFVLCVKFSRGGLSRLCWLAGSLGLMEWLRGRLFTGFPWAAPGLTADGMGALAQTVALVGMEGFTVLILLWGGSWLLVLSRHSRRCERVTAGFVLLTLPLLWSWGEERLNQHPLETVPGIILRIVQPNIAQNDKWREDHMTKIFDQLLEMAARPSQTGAAITHIIMPEASIPFLIEESPASLAQVADRLTPGQLMIAGSLRREADTKGGEDRVYNSVLIFSSSGEVIGTYDKRHLVPGGEFLPFEAVLKPLGFRRLVELPSSFTVGTGPQLLRLPPAPPAGFSICYEAIFPTSLVGEVRPSWLISITNDGWFGASNGPYQHLAQARLRTIEQGLPMARSANTGISAVIDSYGRVVAQSPLMVPAVLDVPLPVSAPLTFYARAPNSISLVVIFLTLSIGLATRCTARV